MVIGVRDNCRIGYIRGSRFGAVVEKDTVIRS